MLRQESQRTVFEDAREHLDEIKSNGSLPQTRCLRCVSAVSYFFVPRHYLFKIRIGFLFLTEKVGKDMKREEIFRATSAPR